MPIFEYACRKCGHRFEQLVYGQAAPECPACRGKRVEKQLSVFAAATRGGEATHRRPAPAQCLSVFRRTVAACDTIATSRRRCWGRSGRSAIGGSGPCWCWGTIRESGCR